MPDPGRSTVDEAEVLPIASYANCLSSFLRPFPPVGLNALGLGYGAPWAMERIAPSLPSVAVEGLPSLDGGANPIYVLARDVLLTDSGYTPFNVS